MTDQIKRADLEPKILERLAYASACALDIATEVAESAEVVYAVLDELERDGLVSRVADPRCKSIYQAVFELAAS